MNPVREPGEYTQARRTLTTLDVADDLRFRVRSLLPTLRRFLSSSASTRASASAQHDASRDARRIV